MFDVGWSEVLVIVIVALLVVGPKELPSLLYKFGKIINKIRFSISHYRILFDKIIEDAAINNDYKCLDNIVSDESEQK